MFLTCKFKVHNPSQAKRKQLDLVMEEYTNVFRETLAYCQNNIEAIREGGKLVLQSGKEKYNDKKIASLIKPKSPILSSNVNDAMSTDIGRVMASYLALADGDKQEAGFPVQRLAEEYSEALVDLCLNGCDLEQEKLLTAKMMTSRKVKFRPIPFIRSRDFSMLSKGEQYFILLPIFAAKDREQVMYSDLFDIGQAKPFKKKAKTCILLPIKLGSWQYHKFILPMAEGFIFPKEAKLSKVENEYFVDVAFEFEDEPQYEPETYLGVDRGINKTVAWGLVDAEGKVLNVGSFDDELRQIRVRAAKRVQGKARRGGKISKKDYRQKELDGIMHRIANSLLALAKEHQAMIVLEGLDGKFQVHGKFNKSAFIKLEKIIRYKGKMMGVPVRSVWAAHTSLICIHCGAVGNAKEDRSKDRSTFTCPECGKVEDADEMAGINIARRGFYRKLQWEKSGGWRGFHQSFANQEHFEAKNDLRN